MSAYSDEFEGRRECRKCGHTSGAAWKLVHRATGARIGRLEIVYDCDCVPAARRRPPREVEEIDDAAVARADAWARRAHAVAAARREARDLGLSGLPADPRKWAEVVRTSHLCACNQARLLDLVERIIALDAAEVA